MNKAVSMGIIGGADGPTAIFVTGDPKGFFVAIGVAVAIVTAVVVLVIRKKRK